MITHAPTTATFLVVTNRPKYYALPRNHTKKAVDSDEAALASGLLLRQRPPSLPNELPEVPWIVFDTNLDTRLTISGYTWLSNPHPGHTNFKQVCDRRRTGK